MPDRARHLAVVDAGADHGAEPRALHQEVQRERRPATAITTTASRYAGKARPRDAHRLLQERRRRDRDRIAAPDDEARSAMMKATPSVTSTWPSTLPPSLRRMSRSSRPPKSATREAGGERRQPEVRHAP